MITEGSNGRMIEVTPEKELVWEFISPYFGTDGISNYVYRGYRVPYAWVPQLDRPEEKAIPKVDLSKFRVPGTEWKAEAQVIKVVEAKGFPTVSQLCVADIDE